MLKHTVVRAMASCENRMSAMLESTENRMSATLESECKELWRQFASIGTEMKVSHPGKCVLGLVFLVPIS